MAGIGFRLKKYFKEQSFLGNIQGAVYSVVISSGPWLISVITIAIVSYFAQLKIGISDLYILKSVICYTYAVSLIIFGIIEMPLTRYLADQLYKNDYTTFKSVFISFLALAAIIGFFISSIFYSFFDFAAISKMAASTFFTSVLVIWISMIFLSAAKNYHQIIISFILGGATSVIASIVMGQYWGLDGYIIGYSIGQAIIALLLCLNLFMEFKGADYASLEIVQYYSRFRVLIFVGFFYYMAIWIDKFIFWFGPQGQQVLGLFYTNQYYDTSMFLAYLTIVPSLAIFLVQVETNFAKSYAYYFHAIDSKNNLNILNSNIDDIIKSLQKALYNLIKIQTFVSVICWYFAEQITHALYLPSMMITMFRYGVIGAYLQVLFLIMNIVLLYFLAQRKVLLHYVVFFLSNAVLTYASTMMDFKYYGIGYLLSCLITFLMTFYALNKHLQLINFHTFMGQPISTE
jgi:uncharacterized membrane protein